ncbi:MAG: PEGA domain-containing protein [Polyangiaceae bacterium]
MSKEISTASNLTCTEEWPDELTAEYRRGRDGERIDPSRSGAQSVESIFARAKAIGVSLPMPFPFAIYVRACANLAGEGRRPASARDHHGRYARPELEPRRIQVGFEGQVKIDWTDGSAWAASEPLELDRSYRSPEERRGLHTDDRADLYSVTLSIAELFVLKRLSKSGASIQDSEGWEDWTELVRRGLPRDLATLFRRALSDSAELRPVGVHSVLEELARIGRKHGLTAHRAAIASCLHRLFAEPTLSHRHRVISAVRPRGDLDVFAELRKKPASTPPPLPTGERRPSVSPRDVMLPPAIVPPVSVALPRSPPMRPARRSESDTPPAVAHSIPPPKFPPLRPRRRGLSAALGVTRISRNTLGALAAAFVVIAGVPLVANRSGKIVTAATGHNGELLGDAAIVIDSKQRCSGPRCTFEVSRGLHEVVVRADGYLPELRLVAIESGDPVVLNFRLQRGGSSIEVSGRPETASLIVDGRWMGRLPLDVDVTPGVHRVRVEANRFVPEERWVDVKAGATRKMLDFTLTPRVGTVTVDVHPADAAVSFVSGSERIECLESSQVELDVSRDWTLIAAKDGFQTLRAPVVWNDGFEKNLVVTLEKISALRGVR